MTGGQPGLGLDLIQSVQQAIVRGFHVDWLTLRDGPQMTATEVLQRRDERLRLLGPVVSRMQPPDHLALRVCELVILGSHRNTTIARCCTCGVSRRLRTLIIERRERQDTRDQIDAVRDFYLGLHPDWKYHAGGRPVGSAKDIPEFRVPGPGVAFEHPVTGRPGASRPGSIYVDLTFETPTGLVHIQTVDIDSDGLPTERELRTARRLADVTGRPVYLIPKIWQLEEIERRSSDFLPIEVR